MASKTKKETEIVPEFSDKIALARFRKAAEDYIKKATASRESARETLVRLGIATKSGNLTSKYK